MMAETDSSILQQILEQLLAGYWDWDIPSGNEFLSPTFKKMFGYEDHELPNHASTWQQLIFEEDLPGVLDCFEKHVKSKGAIPYYNEVRYRHKDGSTVWVICSGKVIEWDADGSPKRMVGCHVDISDHKRMEERMRRAELRLRSLIENTTDAVFCYEYDPPVPTDLPVEEQVRRMYDCTLADCNLVCAKSYGATSVEEVIGRSLTQLFGTTPHSLDKLFRALIEGGYRIIDGEATEKLPDGTERFFLNNGYGVVEDGHLCRVWGTFRDITDRKKAEEELMKAQRLDSLGVLAGGIAHDFNNLLTGLFGFIDLAQSCVTDNREATEYLDEALTCFSRASDLTRQMLTFAKGGVPSRKVISVEPTLRESIQLSLSGSNIKAEVDVPDDLPSIKADRSQLHQVFNNVLLNARQAMPDGGVVAIEVRQVELEEDKLREMAAGRFLQVSVRDQGTGIPSELLPKIFDPFFTTKQAGSGLGLATAYSIIKKHDGHIAIDSDMGVGTTVTITLPAAREDTKQKAQESRGASNNDGDVLIMDDEPMVRIVASQMIQSMGYATICAKSGEEALSVYEKYMKDGKKFSAVVLDLTVVGGMGGAETMRKLLELDPNARGIVSSGYSDSEVLANPREHGFKARVAKPFRMDDLVRALDSVVVEK